MNRFLKIFAYCETGSDAWWFSFVILLAEIPLLRALLPECFCGLRSHLRKERDYG